MSPFRAVRAFSLIVFAHVLLTSSLAFSQTEEPEPVVPQNLLKLIHTPEVQKELSLEGDARFLEILRKIDSVWWPSRILPEAKQEETTRELEERLRASLSEILSPERLRRLREVEMQSQGARALLRADVAEVIRLDSKELGSIKTAFRATDAIARKLNQKIGGDAELEKQLQTAREKEQSVLTGILTSSHLRDLGKLMGEPFRMTELKRIYPLAPELIDSGEWTGTKPASLGAQRGKVVLVHFYAFQCHNCVANFKHYNRWHEALTKKGVAVIGIQTPETSAERDPKLVKRAATEQGFKFPVLIDVNNSNWNAWGNTMWPTVYVIDKNGYIRFWWQGELNWEGATGDKSIEKLVDELLTE